MRRSDSRLKLGFIGCGRVTETRHLPALQNVREAEVIAVADVKRDCLDQVANRFQIKRRYLDIAALLSDPEIEAVAVCVPVQFHVQIALAALEHGKHVFVEKPLALTVDEADRLMQVASRSSRKVMVGFNLRWHRLIRRARATIEDGGVGKPELMRTALTSYYRTVPEWRKHRKSGGGVLFELAVHHFDLWRFLLQAEVTEIFATIHSDQWDDEIAAVTARMANGVLVTSVFSQCTSETQEVEVYGRAGRLQVSCYDFDGMELAPPARFPGDIRTRIQRMGTMFKELPQGIRGILQGRGDFVASYQAEWRHFAHCIRRDLAIESTIADGREALRVVLAALTSASTGQPIAISRLAPGSTPSLATQM